MSVPKLFSPGPVMVEDNVRAALLHYDICHRGKEFEEMFADTLQKINVIFGADDSYKSVIVSGSGTSANETVLSSIFKEKNDSVLLVSNGTFGERLEEIILKYKIPMVKPDFEWAEYPDVNIIEEKLSNNPDVKVVAMVFHETSTGMINPVYEVGQLCKKYGKLFFVDCVSAAGGENIDVVRNNIDVATGVGGKCVGAFPGSAYICAKESLLESIKEEDCKNVYLNLYKHYHYAKNTRQTPNTPNLTLFWALNAALTNIINKGLDKQIETYKERAKILRNGIKELGLRVLLDEKYMSNSVTSVFLPDRIKVDDFLAEMEKDGYVLYAGKGKYYEQNMFQVANMGNIKIEECYELLKIIDKNIKKLQPNNCN